MDVLRESISLDDVEKALKLLPKTLDETYERILQSIPDNRKSDAIRILQWLIFSARPLRIEEVAELLVSNPDMKIPSSMSKDVRSTLRISLHIVGALSQFRSLQTNMILQIPTKRSDWPISRFRNS